MQEKLALLGQAAARQVLMHLDGVAVDLQHPERGLDFAGGRGVGLFGLVRDHHAKVAPGLGTEAGERHRQGGRATIGRDQDIDEGHGYRRFLLCAVSAGAGAGSGGIARPCSLRGPYGAATAGRERFTRSGGDAFWPDFCTAPVLSGRRFADPCDDTGRRVILYVREEFNTPP